MKQIQNFLGGFTCIFVGLSIIALMIYGLTFVYHYLKGYIGEERSIVILGIFFASVIGGFFCMAEDGE